MVSIRLFYTVLLIPIIIGCGSVKPFGYAEQTLEESISTKLRRVDSYEVSAKWYHKSDSIKELYIRFNTHQFLANKFEHNLKRARLDIEIRKGSLSNEILFSFSEEYTFYAPDSLIQSKISVPISNDEFFIVYTLTDLNKNQYSNLTGWEYFSDKHAYSDFLFHSLRSKEPIYKNAPANTPLVFDTRFEQSEIIVKYYNTNEIKHTLPFETSREHLGWNSPDSVFSIQVSDTLLFRSPGYYYFPCDARYDKNGLVVIDSDTVNYTNLISPLVYLCSDKEMEALNRAINKREVFERFWLTLADNDQDDAARLIKEYYSRVNYSNNNFTSYKQGWKTDRGMLYIMFGKPTHTDDTGLRKLWVYDQYDKINSNTFSFEWQSDSHSLNDFVLERNVFYRSLWNMAVNSWRAGFVN